MLPPHPDIYSINTSSSSEVERYCLKIRYLLKHMFHGSSGAINRAATICYPTFGRDTFDVYTAYHPTY